MATFPIQVKLSGSNLQFSIAGPPDVVTISKDGTQIDVQTKDEVNLSLVYTGSLQGIKIANTATGVAGATVHGSILNEDSTVLNSANQVAFLITRTATGVINVLDTVAVLGATWYFSLNLDGTWYDPQIYNKGTT